MTTQRRWPLWLAIAILVGIMVLFTWLGAGAVQ